MAKVKYTPPPDFTAENLDRGYTIEELEQMKSKTSKPVSNQFPVKPGTRIVDTTNEWWNK